MKSYLHTYLSKGNRGTWWMFVAMFFTLLGTCFVFHRLVFNDIPPLNNWELYIISKISACLLFSSIVFVTRSRWWALGLTLVITVWAVSNWIYYQAYSLFLSWSVIRLATNLTGFWDAILIYLDYRLLLLLVPTIVFCCLFVFAPKERSRLWWPFAVCMVLGIGMSMRTNYLIHSIREKIGYRDGELTFEKLLPLYVNETRLVQDWESEYSLVQEHSIAAYLPLSMVYDLKVHSLRSTSRTALNSEEQELMQGLKPRSSEPVSPNSHLVIVLVESFESWALDSTNAMPHLQALRASEHSLYAGKMRSQIRFGMSGDGQMTLNTGLLPIESGVACILYGTNTFPSLAQYYPHGVVVSPSRGTWNQGTVTYSYGYQSLIEPSQIAWLSWNDEEVFRAACETLHEADRPVCMQILTIASHAPFDRVSALWDGLPEEMPNDYKRYLTCLHYTDSCIGALVDSLKANGLYEQTTIVVTGDHTVFNKSGAIHDWVPFLVVSPQIEESVRVEEECYQMDIYPTLLYLLGLSDHGWRGLGANLLNEEARTHRPLSTAELYRLSDKLIRSNYFAGDTSKVMSEPMEVRSKGDHQHYIAHAGGAIHGDRYSNCLEAVDNSLAHGIEYIELDLSFTADSQLVAWHDWSWGGWKKAPTHAEFMGHPVFGKYTPMDVPMIDSLMCTYPQMKLVTDKISDPNVIDRYFHAYKERVWVECFLDADYYALRKMGYHVLRSEEPPTRSDVRKHIFTRFSLRDLRIKSYTFSGWDCPDTNDRHGECFAMFVVPKNMTRAHADTLFNKDPRIQFVYIDEIEN